MAQDQDWPIGLSLQEPPGQPDPVSTGKGHFSEGPVESTRSDLEDPILRTGAGVTDEIGEAEGSYDEDDQGKAQQKGQE